ncbi:hypothetical protein E4T44_02958 [Aureobasidium sp. EXF-8845]|nr:hypothetical protein E4T44_02958 [Aureobasidium sp. EXF-8845]KAI4855189.1 hypothetical protein E4T45_03375 [Aureobasidium sp. EXF-8846]
MCWGIEENIYCEICRGMTSLDINWQGCHIKTEANDGGNPEDVYPERFNHPGFSDTKPVIDVPRVEYPAPTFYESFSDIENLAGPADELPSYDEAMGESPAPPSYDLTQLRDAEFDGGLIPSIAYTRALKRHRQLMSIAKHNRRLINEFLNQNPHLSAIQLLDYATEVIESFLFDQEQLISRISLLQGHLYTVDAEIAALPSPPEIAVLEYRRQSIIRELEGYAGQDNQLDTAEDWELRLESLLSHIGTEIVNVNMASLRASVCDLLDNL